MKLHLPKNLMAALVLAYAISAGSAIALNYTANTTEYDIGTGESNTKLVNPTVGEPGVVIGDGVTVGTYADNKLIVDGIGSTTTPCTNNLIIQKTGKWWVSTGDLTINGTGQVAVGGKSADGSKYASLTADKITVNGKEDVVNLKASVVHANSLVVKSGNVEIHTGSSDFSQGNAFLMSTLSGETPKQARVENSIDISGGKLVIGSTNGAYVASKAHYVMGFGFDSLTGIGAKSATVTQTGGDMRVYGDSIARVGFTIDQNGTNDSTMYFSDNLAITNTGTVTIKQSNDNAELIIGRIVNDADTKSGTINVNLTQTGAGDIQLASGTSFNGAKGNVNINQSGDGNIIIGGGINKEKVGVLNIEASRAAFTSDGTTYNLTQSGTGSISIESDAEITANSVAVANGSDLVVNGKLNIATGISEPDSAKLNGSVLGTGTVTQTAGKITVGETGTISVSNMSVNGTLENNGTISSNTTVTANGELTNNEGGVISGDITVSGGSFVNKGTVEIAATQPSLLTAAEGDIATLSEADDMLKLTITGGQVENYGTFNGAISVEGGILNLMDGSVGDITMTAGDIVVHDESYTGNLTLNGGTITFMKGAILNVADNAVVDLNDVKVFVMVEDLDALAVGDVIQLFNQSTGTMEFNNTIITFTDGENYVEAPVSGAEGDSVAGGTVTVVPEPTTATLSLLALAALAARRRRR